LTRGAPLAQGDSHAPERRRPEEWSPRAAKKPTGALEIRAMAEDSLTIRLREGNPNPNISTPLAAGLNWLASAVELARPHLDRISVSLRTVEEPDGSLWYELKLSRAGVQLWRQYNRDAELLAAAFVIEAERGAWS
jgi:hypothetical protein